MQLLLFQSEGISCKSIKMRYMVASGNEIIGEVFLKKMEGMRSGPAAEFDFRLQRILFIIPGEILISSRVACSTSDGKREGNSGKSPLSLVNTELK